MHLTNTNVIICLFVILKVLSSNLFSVNEPHQCRGYTCRFACESAGKWALAERIPSPASKSSTPLEIGLRRTFLRQKKKKFPRTVFHWNARRKWRFPAPHHGLVAHIVGVPAGVVGIPKLCEKRCLAGIVVLTEMPIETKLFNHFQQETSEQRRQC